MDYEVMGYEAANLVRMRILVSNEEVDALSTIVHRDNAEFRGRKMLQALREEIPRHMFEVALQAAIGVGGALVPAACRSRPTRSPVAALPGLLRVVGSARALLRRAL